MLVFKYTIILIYSLHTIKNPNTCLAFPLNVGGLAMFIFDPVLDWEIAAAVTSFYILLTPSTNNACICTCITIIYCCLIICWRFIELLSGTVHTRVEVYRIDSEMSKLVEWPWLQLMCCTICLPHGCNFRWREESPSGSEYWLMCHCWTLEVKFNKSLSSSIIRLANYNVTTSLIYKLIL